MSDVVADAAVVGARAAARPYADAAGLLLARRAGSPCALVLSWPPHAGGRGVRRPAAAGAGALAARLSGRGFEARASGRLVRAALPAGVDPSPALARAAATCAGPVVLLLAGARDEAGEELLAAARRIVVVTPPGEALAALALGDRAGEGGAVPAPGLTDALVVRAGLLVPDALREALAGPLGEVAA